MSAVSRTIMKLTAIILMAGHRWGPMVVKPFAWAYRAYALTASRTNIHHNYFERCSGEVEIVSIKSGDNQINNNTFYECEGGLVLRHGEAKYSKRKRIHR